jgi:hypothetical protein
MSAKLDPYIRIRDEYFANAESFAGKREYRKASELLWGAVTQTIKALAAKHGLVIEAHSQFFDFMQELAKETEDEAIYKTFLFLNDLHRNFYDEKIRPSDFGIYLKEAYDFIVKLNTLMEKM